MNHEDYQRIAAMHAALFTLYTVCRAMESGVDAERPSEERFQQAMADALSALQAEARANA